jgi:hypothetical protein
MRKIMMMAETQGGAVVPSETKIYGASWDGGTNPALTRTDDAVGMVAAAGVDAGVVTNNFDTAEIYKDITDVTDAYGNVFVRIPKIYIEKTVVGAACTWRISRTSFSAACYVPKCVGSDGYAYIGKYNASLDAGLTKLCSVTGVAPLVSKTIVEFRGYAQAVGSGYQQMDIHAVDLTQVLFIIEFATLHSQSIMTGFTAVANAAAINSGVCDSVVATSGGQHSLSDGAHACKYRGIENPWGNISQFVDGININNNQAWVCQVAADYASNVFASPYEQLGYANKNGNGWLSSLGYDSTRPYAQLPVGVLGGGLNYYNDYYSQSAGQRIAFFGGHWSGGTYAGAFGWSLYGASSIADSSVGGRLVRKVL